ncbi:MAG TPA: hypothetical protein VN641_09160 [Urbifossiella sp.]|nr:hypothetical protein [Urbifossiella sp.]
MNSSDPIRLTADGTFKSDPVFVKDGGEIVYTLLETPVQMRLIRLIVADKTVSKLNPTATTNEFEASFTADGSHYAFVQSRGNLNMKMVIRELATNKDAVFDPGGGFAGVRRPTFHPAGDRVTFAIPGETGQEIASVSRNATDKKTLATGGINNWPAYSPDGRRIAFSSSRDGTFDLYVMNANGSGVRRVVKLDGMQMRPSWSPDGQRLAFTSNHAGSYDLWIVRLDGTGLVRLTGSAERDDYSAWRPDGRQIAFVGERNGKFDLYLASIPN